MKPHYLAAILCINLNYYNLSGQGHLEPNLTSKLVPKRPDICVATNNFFAKFINFNGSWIYEDFVERINAKSNELQKIKNEKKKLIASDLFYSIKYYEEKAGLASDYEEMNYINRLMSIPYDKNENDKFFKVKE